MMQCREFRVAKKKYIKYCTNFEQNVGNYMYTGMEFKKSDLYIHVV